jgi:hypothetical protein
MAKKRAKVTVRTAKVTVRSRSRRSSKDESRTVDRGPVVYNYSDGRLTLRQF